MPLPFEPAGMGHLRLPNRFTRSGTWEGLAAEDGSVTGDLIQATVRLVQGGVGLIITGFASVSPGGSSGSRHLSLWDDRYSSGLSSLARAVTGMDGKIVLQAGHAGCYSRGCGSQDTIRPGPSTISLPCGPEVREMTCREIHDCEEDFCHAAGIAKRAGFSGVQIHAAHGYLLSEFLSPFYNHRTDTYGRSPAGRERFLCEVSRGVRDTVGDRYPVLLKINSDDYLPGGFSLPDLSDNILSVFHESIDCIEISGGSQAAPVRFWPIRPGRIGEGHEGYYRRASRAFREKTDVPVALVGGIRSIGTAEGFLSYGIADFISLSRPLIREPDLVQRRQSGNRRISSCLSCDCCYRRFVEGRGFGCEIEERTKNQASVTEYNNSIPSGGNNG
ncbi:MAG: NADH:flavin oxidoreductase [Methanoregulaceae archaeon]